MAAMFSAAITVALGQGQTFSIQIVADNDFAVFAGTSNSVTSLVYQNDVDWPHQLSNLSTLNFTLQSGETTFYLLALGGGGDENISGTVNGVDLTTINVSMSSDIGPYLTGYEAQANGGTVGSGTFSPSLADVQAAFDFLTWGNTTPTTGGDTVAAQSPTGHGFHFDPSTAHLFAFNASDVGVADVPEPSTYALLGIGTLALVLALRPSKSRG